MFRGDFLADLVNRNELTRGAELGLWKGRTFFHLLEHCPQLHMIGVDEWKHRPELIDVPGGMTYEGYKMAGLEAFVRNGAEKYGKRARIIQASTVDAARQIDDGSLDFVFIDASHDYHSVLGDILHWRPKLKPGGYLTGHDISWPSVKQAVEEVVHKGLLCHLEGCPDVWGYEIYDDDDGGIWYAQV